MRVWCGVKSIRTPFGYYSNLVGFNFWMDSVQSLNHPWLVYNLSTDCICIKMAKSHDIQLIILYAEIHMLNFELKPLEMFNLNEILKVNMVIYFKWTKVCTSPCDTRRCHTFDQKTLFPLKIARNGVKFRISEFLVISIEYFHSKESVATFVWKMPILQDFPIPREIKRFYLSKNFKY